MRLSIAHKVLLRASFQNQISSFQEIISQKPSVQWTVSLCIAKTKKFLLCQLMCLFSSAVLQTDQSICLLKKLGNLLVFINLWYNQRILKSRTFNREILTLQGSSWNKTHLLMPPTVTTLSRYGNKGEAFTQFPTSVAI